MDKNIRATKNKKLHSSELFFVKGTDGQFNGVLLNKLVSEVEFMAIYRLDGTEVNTNVKVFYFDDENEFELRIYLFDGEVRRFRYSLAEGEFVQIPEGLQYKAV